MLTETRGQRLQSSPISLQNKLQISYAIPDFLDYPKQFGIWLIDVTRFDLWYRIAVAGYLLSGFLWSFFVELHGSSQTLWNINNLLFSSREDLPLLQKADTIFIRNLM